MFTPILLCVQNTCELKKKHYQHTLQNVSGYSFLSFKDFNLHRANHLFFAEWLLPAGLVGHYILQPCHRGLVCTWLIIHFDCAFTCHLTFLEKPNNDIKLHYEKLSLPASCLAMRIQDNLSATNSLGKLFCKPSVNCNVVVVQQVSHKKQVICWLHNI